MKKTQKPLRLCRETLQQLIDAQVSQAEGGKFPPLEPETNGITCWCT